MPLLAGKTYDPATAVNKSGTALSAMQAFDTTNLRLTFTVPAGGIVTVRLGGGAITGATTFAQILLGVLEGSTVRGRVAPQTTMNGTAIATTMASPSAMFPVSGLTPSASLTWDAAYAIEVVGGAGSVYRYGGPNDTTTTNAAGGIFFEIWSP